MPTKPQKQPIFNSDKELADFLLANLTDSLKQSIRLTVKIMIRQEMESLREEVNEKLSFNGHYQRGMVSAIGKINEINVPRFREHPWEVLPLKSLGVFDQEKEKFFKLVAEMHRLGISQRKIKQLCQTCFGVKVSKNKVGLVHKELAQQESLQINSQDLSGDEFAYLLLDGLWVKCKSWGLKESDKTVLLCALGITADGQRKIIGFQPAEREDFENWSGLLENLRGRGLAAKPLSLVIADDNGGLTKAVSHLLPNVKIQVCVAHKMRNVLGRTRHKNKEALAADLKPIYQAQTKGEAVEKMKTFVKNWYVAEPKAVSSLRYDFERTLTYLDFPKELWSKIRTTNMLEREFREVRRRIRVFDSSFENGQSLMNYSNSVFDYLNHHYPVGVIHTKT